MSPIDHRLNYAATTRNRDAIGSALLQAIRSTNLPCPQILEIASGSGEHATYLAPQIAESYPGSQWQPTDLEAKCIASIDAWRDSMAPASRESIHASAILNVCHRPWPWPDHKFNVIVNINMVHIAPWRCCEDLIQEAGRMVPKHGLLFLYGPFMRNGQHTAPSNAAFSQQLAQQDPSWGLRNLEDVVHLAQEAKFDLSKVIEMPANNLSLVFIRD